MTAPAAMPSEEDVARAIAQADEQNGGLPYDARIAMGKHVREHLFDQARAVLTLFAPILTEKERELTSFRQYVAMHRARALSAEAALGRVKDVASHWQHFVETTMLPGEEKQLTEGILAIAAAIRAQGE